MDDILIIGGGITGLTLALSLHQIGIPCRVFEAAAEFKPLGVGINILPHGVRELSELGLQDALARVAVETREMAYYNRFGQFIYSEPRGRFAGYDWPQFSIHRGDLQGVLLDAARERLGADRVLFGHRCMGVEQDADGVSVHFADAATGNALPPQRGKLALGCDGIHSAVRKQLYPDEGAPAYQGINMWRGVTRRKPFLDGGTMILSGWYDVGMMVIYPIRENIDAEGNQLINWIAQVQSSRTVPQNWSLPGKLEDFLPIYADWRFDWLDAVDMIRKADTILEYPMVDREPLERWSFGRITLLGDAAHPMYPRGGTGAGQGILDARTMAGCLKRNGDPVAALKAYEEARLKAANAVVVMNRSAASDVLLQVVHDRSGDRPFTRIEDIVSRDELSELSEKYKRVAGFEREALRQRPSLVAP